MNRASLKPLIFKEEKRREKKKAENTLVQAIVEAMGVKAQPQTTQ